MTLIVGEVIAVKGVNVTLKVFEESNKDILFFDGEKYKGISIREFVTIQRGFKSIVCIVEGEYLDETRYESDGNENVIYLRKVEVKPIGYFDGSEFFEGIKHLPRIKDPVYLASEHQIQTIFGREAKEKGFIIGDLLKENLPVSLPWRKLFNSHIGIFGNTGSGKSNTLTNLYTTLFKQKKSGIQGKSDFVILDFNGEYTRNQLITARYKKVYNLSTKNSEGDKLPISANEFWDAETLRILFKAAPNTQTPFLNRVVRGRKRYGNNPNSLLNYVKSTFEKNFRAQAQKRESVDLLITVAKVINNPELENVLSRLSWWARDSCFVLDGSWFNGGDANAYNVHFEQLVNNIVVENISFFEELILRINLQLVNDLLSGYVQFDHIQPLLKRVS